MEEENVFCVVCGEKVPALFHQYGPTVLKVTNCGRCGNVADKYIEYDPVIIMLDMILLSKEAYRHVLFNTKFKAYWKLLILLLFMESYLQWSSKDFHKAKLTELCTNENDSSLHESSCLELENADENDPFMMEKGVYVTFCGVFCGMVAFIISAILLSVFMIKAFNHRRKVKLELFIKMITIGGLGHFLMLPTLIWGNGDDRYMHYALVSAYTMLKMVTVHSVVFECNKLQSVIIFMLSWIFKSSVINYLKDIFVHFL